MFSVKNAPATRKNFDLINSFRAELLLLVNIGTGPLENSSSVLGISLKFIFSG